MRAHHIFERKVDRVDELVDELRAANEPGLAEEVNDAMRTGEDVVVEIDDAECELDRAIERAEETLGGEA